LSSGIPFCGLFKAAAAALETKLCVIAECLAALNTFFPDFPSHLVCCRHSAERPHTDGIFHISIRSRPGPAIVTLVYISIRQNRLQYRRTVFTHTAAAAAIQ
jgi:hypothetical protein